MKRLVLSLALMLALLFGTDRVLGTVLASLFRASNSDDGDTLSRGIATHAPVLVVGSSRAKNHYIPDLLATRLGVPVYNLGHPGLFGSAYPYGVAEMVLAHYTPRLWILEVESTIYAFPEEMAPLSCFLPYADQYPAISELVNHRSHYEPLKRLSRIYPYNSLVASLVGPWLGHASEAHLGWIGVPGQLEPQDTLQAPEDPAPGTAAAAFHPPADSLKMHYLRKMVADLRAHGVEIVAVRSPYYLRGPSDRWHDRQVRENLRAVFRSVGVRYFDFTSLDEPVFHNASLYHDNSHLNPRGAAVFTAMVADSIRSLRLPGLTTLSSTATAAAAARESRIPAVR